MRVRVTLALTGLCVGALAACSAAAPAASPTGTPITSSSPSASPTPYVVAEASEWTTAMESDDTQELSALIDATGPTAIIDGRPALSIAADAGNADAVAILVEAGADVEIRDERERSKWTALHFATNANCVPCMETLIAAGADPLHRDSFFPARGPMHIAASVGAIDALELLLASGVEVDTFDGAGGHALLWAAFKGQTDTAVFLLEQGADPTIVDGSRNNAAQRATGAGHEELGLLLEEAIDDWQASH